MSNQKNQSKQPDQPTNFPKVTRSQYRANKKSLIRKEKQNTHRIYLIHCAGEKGWCEAGEHSALFFHYEVVKRLGLGYQFFSDSDDFYAPYEIGYVRIPSIDTACHWVKEAGLYESEGYDSNRTFYIELNKTFSEQEIEDYRAKEARRRLESLSIAPADNLAPEFYQLLINLSGCIHKTCNSGLSQLARNTIGTNIFQNFIDTLRLYHKITSANKKQTADILAAWHQIRINIFETIFEFKAINDAKLIEDRTICLNIVETLQRSLTLVDREIKRLTKNNKEKPNAQK